MIELIGMKIEVWLSLVERYVRDVEVASSNLVTSTISSVHNEFGLWILDFSFQKSYFIMIKATQRHLWQDISISALLACRIIKVLSII